MDTKAYAETELPKLKQLAGDLLAAEAPDPAVLDEIASLAASVATQLREHARQERVREVAEAAGAIFPNAPADLASRLAGAAPSVLSSLGNLLDEASQARSAFARADAALLAAHGRGEYGAMVPLAVEAESQKKAFDRAIDEFAGQLGYEGLTAAIAVAAAPTADGAPETPASSDAPSAEAEPATVETEPELEASDDHADMAADPGPAAESQPGRRRIRDLIRQVRSTEEAPAAR